MNGISRRQFAYVASLAAGAWIPSARPASAQMAGGGRDLLTRPVAVPRDFVGMHFHHWPIGNPPSPAPTYGYGTVRSHDAGVSWNSIHVAPGQFRWDKLDRWVDFFAGKGKTVIYTVYGTPSWASSQPDLKDAYGNMGAGAAPRDMSVLGDFVQALVSRYNTPSHRQIHFIETWNEPHFLQNGRGFWWGSSAQMVQVSRAIYSAAKHSDPGIRVMSAAFDGLPQGHYTTGTSGILAGMRNFFQDNSADTPGRWFDAFSIHTYNADIMDPMHGLEGTVLQVKETLQHFGVSVPIYTTETGYTEDSFFGRSSPEVKGTLLRRQAAVQAALGIRALCFYSHDDNYCGNPSVNPAVATAINDVNTRLAGQTLQQVTVLPGGTVHVKTQAGSFQW